MLAQNPSLQPVRIMADAIAPGVPAQDLVVSPQHRMLIETAATQLWMGEDQVLVKAKDMLHRPGVLRADVNAVRYIHLMCPAHEIILAENAWTESYQPGAASRDDPELCAELQLLFPDKLPSEAIDYPAARLSAKRHEARMIF
jgi:hypothetical protein